MKFYAYKPDADGNEPYGTCHKILFELKTVKGAIRRARRILGNNVRVFTYTNIFDRDDFRQLVYSDDC